MPIQLSGSLVITGSITTTGVITMSGSIASASYSSNSDLLQGTGSIGFATTASLLEVSSSQQQISASLLNVIAIGATTGSNSFRATQSITGSLTVTGQIIAQTINVQQVTSSIIYSSGSNIFGCDLNSRQTFTGSFYQTGSSMNINAGCVIIGNTTSPACDFFFNVTTVCAGTNATVAQFYNAEYTSGTRGFIRVRNSTNINGTTSAYIGQGQDSKTYIYNNDPSRAGDIVITSTGLVGIGTCTPISQLTIAASNPTTAGNICTALSLAGIRLFPVSGTTNGLSIGIAGANTSYLQAQYASDCSAAPLALQPYNGNVGISTVTPTNGKLEVQTTNTSAGLWVQTGGTTSGYTIADFRTGTNASALQILGNSNSIFGGATSFLNNLCINGDFTVRGRTTTWGTIALFPDNPGGCNGSSGNTVLLGSVVGCAGYGPQLRFSGATSGEFIDIGQTSAGGFVIEGTDNPRLIITNCGSVGVGCTSPLHNLDIGSVRTNIGGFAFCNMVTGQGVFSTFACVGSDANVVTTITYTNTNDHNRSGVFVARWAYNTSCATLFIVSCLWNDSQNIVTLAFRNHQSGALQICVSGGGGDYRVQALTQGTKAT